MQPITHENVSHIIKRLNRRSFLSNPLFLIINCQFEEKDGDLLVHFNDNELAFPTSKAEHMKGKSVWCYTSELEKLQQQGLTIKHQQPQGVEYFYQTPKLADMAGKDFKTIRNQVNSFKKTYPTLELREQCDKVLAREFIRVWHQVNAGKKTGLARETFDYEYQCSLRMIDLADRLEQVKQLYAFIDGQLAGLTFYSPIHTDFWSAIIQKVDTKYHGISKFLYQEKARRMQAFPDCTLGDDGLDPALAKFKRSLRPVRTDQLTIVDLV